jgi:hypothetical protein
MRDERALQVYLDQTGADYLVTFPGWYPYLVNGKQIIYMSSAAFSPALGGENMVVYLWNDP